MQGATADKAARRKKKPSPPRRTRECNERGYRWLSLRSPAKVASASPNPAKPFASVRVVRAVPLTALAALRSPIVSGVHVEYIQALQPWDL